MTISILIDLVECDCAQPNYQITVQNSGVELFTTKVENPLVLPLLGKCFEICNAKHAEYLQSLSIKEEND